MSLSPLTIILFDGEEEVMEDGGVCAGCFLEGLMNLDIPSPPQRARGAVKEIRKVTLCREVDVDPDLSYLGEFGSSRREGAIEHEPGNPRTYSYFYPANPKYGRQDYERVLAHDNGGWCHVGVVARAEVVVSGVIQRVTSGGLWGIESDSDPEHFEAVEKEQLEELGDVLVALGFTEGEVRGYYSGVE